MKPSALRKVDKNSGMLVLQHDSEKPLESGIAQKARQRISQIPIAPWTLQCMIVDEFLQTRSICQIAECAHGKYRGQLPSLQEINRFK